MFRGGPSASLCGYTLFWNWTPDLMIFCDCAVLSFNHLITAAFGAEKGCSCLLCFKFYLHATIYWKDDSVVTFSFNNVHLSGVQFWLNSFHAIQNKQNIMQPPPYLKNRHWILYLTNKTLQGTLRDHSKKALEHSVAPIDLVYSLSA
jgi:hypothetical protein